jgi:zinc/manganese transport system substrate-binding protein
MQTSSTASTPRRRARALALTATTLAAASLLAACGSGDTTGTVTGGEGPVIAVANPILGAIVRDAVGDRARVEVVMPNGADPHEWRASAKDVARLRSADLVVRNGLDLEAGLEDAIDTARADGVPVFTATDHVDVRTVADGEGDGHGHDEPGHEEPGHGDDAEEHAEGAADPHFWTDPTQVRKVVLALPGAVRSATGADIAAPATAAAARLTALDQRLAREAKTIPPGARRMVTGHESLGYLGRRYGIEVVGAVTPSLSSQGQVSAAHLAALRAAMEGAGTRVVFTETGTPEKVARAVADEANATLVELPSHAVPDDGKYSTYMSDLMGRISTALSRPSGR